MSFSLTEKLRIGVEFRYGRDLTYRQIDFSRDEVISDMSRYSIVVDLQGW